MKSFCGTLSFFFFFLCSISKVFPNKNCKSHDLFKQRMKLNTYNWCCRPGCAVCWRCLEPRCSACWYYSAERTVLEWSQQTSCSMWKTPISQQKIRHMFSAIVLEKFFLIWYTWLSLWRPQSSRPNSRLVEIQWWGISAHRSSLARRPRF